MTANGWMRGDFLKQLKNESDLQRFYLDNQLICFFMLDVFVLF